MDESPRPAAVSSKPAPVSWVRALAAVHERPLAQREEFLHPPRWFVAALLVSLAVDTAALWTLTPRDILPVAALMTVYALTTLIPPVSGPYGYIRIPHVVFVITLCLLWPPPYVLIAAAFGTLAPVVLLRLYDFWRGMLNSFLWAYPALLASLAGHLVLRAVPDPFLGFTAASIATLVAYLSFNFAALPLYRRLRYGDPFFATWWRRVRENPAAEVLAAPPPILLGVVAQSLGHHRWLDVGLTALAAVTMPASRAQLVLYLQSRRTVGEIVDALMMALERAVPGARAHAERVAAIVEAAGRRLNVPEGVLEQWRLAALLHDIGLIDSRSRSAAPPVHAALGGQILSSYPDRIVPAMVTLHHAPWSQTPASLPRLHALGARVLSAAEHYDEGRTGLAPGTSDGGLDQLTGRLETGRDPQAAAAVSGAIRDLARSETA
jgi:hypothetical protein